MRLVKVRSNRSRILWLFSSQRLSQNLQTIETFEAVLNGRNCIRSRVAELFACVAGPASEAVAASQEADFRQRRVRLPLGQA